MDQYGDPGTRQGDDSQSSGRTMQLLPVQNRPLVPSRLRDEVMAQDDETSKTEAITVSGVSEVQAEPFDRRVRSGGRNEEEFPRRILQRQALQHGRQARRSSHHGSRHRPDEQRRQALHASYEQSQRHLAQLAAAGETSSTALAGTQDTPYNIGAQPGPSDHSNVAYTGELQLPGHQPTYGLHHRETGSSSHGNMLDTMQQVVYHAYERHSPTIAFSTLTKQRQIQWSRPDVGDVGLSQYQHNVQTIFGCVRDRRLQEIPALLLQVSKHFVSSVVDIGLHPDGGNQELWDEFNQIWLATMQCQLEMTEDLRSGGALPASQSYLDTETLKTLSQELVDMCDRLHKHGLVDYDVGLAEEEIIEGSDKRRTPGEAENLSQS